jgi:hypothetical protein
MSYSSDVTGRPFTTSSGNGSLNGPPQLVNTPTGPASLVNGHLVYGR